jgi:hypothetical protein
MPSTQGNTFAVGLSHDMGSSYDILYKMFQTCPTVCPDDSRYNQICRATWQMKPGVTTATGATGETCSVAWAKTEVPDSGSGGTGAGGTGGAGGTSGAAGAAGAGNDKDAGSVPMQPSAGDSCACRLTGRASRGAGGAWGFGLAALMGWARRRRRH